MAQKSGFAFVLGLVLGGLTGAAVALLLAPQAGEQTRGMIREKSAVIKEKATHTADEAVHQAEAALQATKERYQEVQHKGEEMIHHQRERLEKVLEAGKKIPFNKLETVTPEEVAAQ